VDFANVCLFWILMADWIYGFPSMWVCRCVDWYLYRRVDKSLCGCVNWRLHGGVDVVYVDVCECASI
jgi:hypothetical protein